MDQILGGLMGRFFNEADQSMMAGTNGKVSDMRVPL
jgi:hypothetical protein